MHEPNEPIKLFKALTQTLQAGKAIEYRNLTLVPLDGPATQLDYILAGEAIQSGTFTVKEVSESGNVNMLLVENKGNRRVLLLDGEELVGAKQNRILNTTILIEANTTQKIPVSCVEQGRWRHISNHFVSGTYAPPGMRQRKSREVTQSFARCGEAISNQGAVWADVQEMVTTFKAQTPTHAMKDAFDQRAEDFGSFVKALPYPKGARGVIAAVSGRFVAMDALDRSDTFKSIWDRLVTGYAADAIFQQSNGCKPFSEKSAKFILDSLSECRTSVFKAVGLGSELRFESELMLGQALVMDDVFIHLSVFPNEPQGQNSEHGGCHIMPPSFRRRVRRPGSEG